MDPNIIKGTQPKQTREIDQLYAKPIITPTITAHIDSIDVASPSALTPFIV